MKVIDGDKGAVIPLQGASRPVGFDQFLSAQLVRRSPDAMLCTDSDSIIVFWSPGAERLFGYTSEEAIGQHISMIVADELHDEHASLLAAAHDTGVYDLDGKSMEAVGLRKDGREVPIDTSFCVWSANGAIMIGAIVRDISNLKRVQAELALARDAAEAASRAKTEFLTNITHEIRTPLNGVVSLADLLAGGELDVRQLEMVQLIRASGETLTNLLSDVIDLARAEAGQIELQSEPLQLGDVVRSVAGLSAALAEAKGLRYEIEIDSTAERSVMGDEPRLRQILSKLLSNAVKFTNGGMVKVSVSQASSADGRFHIKVRDTGIGIAPDLRERVFESFVQGDGSITRSYGGTGLGLAVSRQLADLMDARLSCKSKPGRGSTFTLTIDLPLARPVSQTAPASQAAGSDISANARVLVVDDNPTNRRVIELILQQTGVDLTMTENGLEAVEAFKSGHFDVVLMDTQMPVMDGLTATSIIREFERTMQMRRTPVIMVSANALPEHVQAAIQAGADEHLAKPITPAALINSVMLALAARGEDELDVDIAEYVAA